jgi:coupling of ubiquitin conjugation to ER degradation protein 1
VKGPGQDLIQRYGLQGRVGGKGKEAVVSEEQKKSGWSSDKNARAEALRKRKEEMVLAARRKMEGKEAQGA